MRPGEREELVRLCRLAEELRARSTDYTRADVQAAHKRALAKLHEQVTPKLILELLGDIS